MLQQTQVSRTIDTYKNFIHLFPDPESLASASFNDILHAWQGMGYNRRALSLMKTAQIIMKFHNGMVPEDEKTLLSLPGIGIATARAIQAFAFNKPVILIETNIRAVFIFHFFQNHNTVHDSEIRPFVELTLDTANPRKWYNALMDYGSHLKKLHGNPARLSAHHRRQVPFEGSVRQVRGLILKHVLEEKKVSRSHLLKVLSCDPDVVTRILRILESEGFIVSYDNYIFLAQTGGNYI
ncbi:MAG: A/G-specific adenine glycosylase [Syntrophales bacterium]|nr:A/G-specific adenine glycosylase [Syntrophales bacterium]MDY0043869.1 hypothetical protein [Syntrophales bacterium]